MSIRSALAGLLGELRGNPFDNPAVPIAQAAFMLDVGSPTDAGVLVNERTSIQLASVYNAINVLRQDFASLPIQLFERTSKGSEPITNALYQLLAVEPNPETSAPTFYGTLMVCVLLYGNGYALIQRDGVTPVALWPVHPSLVTPRRVDNGLIYEVNLGGKTLTVQPRDMIHVVGLSQDGMVGMSPIQAAKRTIGTAIAAEKFGARWFGRGSRPSGVLTRPEPPAAQGQGTLKTAPAEKGDKTRESWERAYGGENQGGTAVLPPGWDWKAIGVPPDDAQFLETQHYSRTQIAALYRVPPHMIGDTSRLSNSNHESQALEYITFTLRPWVVAFEAELARKLLPRVGAKAGRYTIRFDFTELQRGDFASQMTGFAIGRQWGFYNADEIRGKIGMNPIGGKAGTLYLAPLNMVDADQIGDEPEEPAQSGDDKPQEPEPKGNGGRNQRMLLHRIAAAYAPLYRDAAGRLAARDKRDSAAVTAIFLPVLSAIADEAGRQARDLHRLNADADLGSERIVRDALKAIEKRAATWTATTVEVDGRDELDRTVRSITLQIFREAGAQLAQAA